MKTPLLEAGTAGKKGMYQLAINLLLLTVGDRNLA